MRIRTDLLTFVGRSSYFAIRYTFYDLKNLPWVTWGVLLQNICMIFVKYFDSLQLVRRFVLIIAIYLLVVNVLSYSTLFLSRARGKRGRTYHPTPSLTHHWDFYRSAARNCIKYCSATTRSGILMKHVTCQCWQGRESLHMELVSQAVSEAPVHNGHCQIVRWTVSAVLSEVKSAVLSTSWSFVLWAVQDMTEIGREFKILRSTHSSFFSQLWNKTARKQFIDEIISIYFPFVWMEGHFLYIFQ